MSYGTDTFAQKKRIREHGIEVGVLKTGENNAITDVKGVTIGQVTIKKGKNIRTGVTAIIPHQGDLYNRKVPAAIYIGNGYGKLAGYSQVKELGNIETPVVLTNTLSVPRAADALLSYTLDQEGHENIRSVNAVVGETNDGYLNDIRGRHIEEKDVLEALSKATDGSVEEGTVGAGTGTMCFGYKGGIGTSSRILPLTAGGYTVGVLVQTNFGGVLEIAGVPIAKELGNYPYEGAYEDNGSADGSCMIVVITDAPLDSRNLERLAKRAMLGLGKTGGIASNGSGDYVIALSVNPEVLIDETEDSDLTGKQVLKNEAMTPLFLATIEATEEAILNSLFMAETIEGREGHKAEELPVKKVLRIMKQYNRIK
ncbi:MAG: P1 family peptidase [Cyclobacteriaceae bacterium]